MFRISGVKFWRPSQFLTIDDGQSARLVTVDIEVQYHQWPTVSNSRPSYLPDPLLQVVRVFLFHF